MSIIIAVTRDDVMRYGANSAIVLQQIRFAAHREESEWTRATLESIAHWCGLTVRQVRRSIDTLLDAGAIERMKFAANRGDQTMSYRVIEGADSGTEPSDQLVTVRGDQEVTSSILPEKEIPPKPPKGGESSSQQSLLEPAESQPAQLATSAKARLRRRKRNVVDLLDAEQRVVFEEWWSSWPTKKRKDDSIRAWSAALEAGVSVDDLNTALANYLASIAAWEKRWNAKQTYLFAAPKFIDGAFIDFVDGADPDRWPGPRQARRDGDVDPDQWEILGDAAFDQGSDDEPW